MKPLWYCDALPLMVGGDTGASGPILRGHMLALLHGLFARKPGYFALAFPPATVWKTRSLLTGALRIFAPHCEELDWLAENLNPIPWFRDYARLIYPRQIPANFKGAWARYARFRVPSLSSDRHENTEHGRLRQRRMAEANAPDVAYFILHSKTTGQRFSLSVKREKSAPFQGDCQPNSYGFSVTTRPFSLPELQWD